MNLKWKSSPSDARTPGRKAQGLRIVLCEIRLALFKSLLGPGKERYLYHFFRPCASAGASGLTASSLVGACHIPDVGSPPGTCFVTQVNVAILQTRPGRDWLALAPHLIEFGHRLPKFAAAEILSGARRNRPQKSEHRETHSHPVP